MSSVTKQGAPPPYTPPIDTKVTPTQSTSNLSFQFSSIKEIEINKKVYIGYLIFLFIACLFIAIVSFAQLSDNDTLGGQQVGDCAAIGYRPARLYVSASNNYLYCGWASPNSSIRLVPAFFGMVISLLAIKFVAIDEKPKFLIANIVLNYIFALLFFIAIIVDGKAIQNSQSYCNQQIAYTTGYGCDYSSYQGAAAFDFFMFVFFVIGAILGHFFYKKIKI